MVINNVDNILLELHKNIARIADSKLAKEVKEIYKEEVDYMYSEFSPLEYERRYENNGFGDENNLDIDIQLGKDSVSLELVNEAESVTSTLRLDTIIEEGRYDWKGQNPEPRPVYQRTSDRILTEQIAENILESGLRKIGYNFK